MTLNRFGLNILDNIDNQLFKIANFFVTSSDNYLKLKFERHLALFVHAGLDLFHSRYKLEIEMKKEVIEQADYLRATEASFATGVTDRTLVSYVLHWNKNKCVTFYRKNRCELKVNNNSSELPVGLYDLTAVWVLFFMLLAGSILKFVAECTFKAKRWNIL